MKRKFAISDIHGQNEWMISLLDAADFNPAVDQLVFCGDLIDRGPDSVGVMKFVKKLHEQHPNHIFVILGNHEVMMRQYIFGGKSHMWLHYGGLEVIEAMKTNFNSIADRNDHLVWLANLPLTYADKDYFYLHAGIDLTYDIHKQPESTTFMELDELYSLAPGSFGNLTVVHGHTPYHSVYRAGNFISCDTGASVWADGKLSLVDLTNQLYYCSDNLIHPIKMVGINDRIHK